MRSTPVLSPRALDELSTEVNHLLEVVEEQQEEINRLRELCESRLTRRDDQANGRYNVITSLVDKITLKPIGISRGKGVVVLPTRPFMLTHESTNTSALIDSDKFILSGVDDVTFSVPVDFYDGPWVGMFDVVTDELVLVYKFTQPVRRGEALTVSFKPSWFA